MKYTCLLRPHANGRYQEASVPLALSETLLLARKAGRDVEPELKAEMGLQWIDFECGELDSKGIDELARSAHIYLLSQRHEDGMVKPLRSAEEAYLGDDLPYILKYKGKTNETFTKYIVNLALCASSFDGGERLKLLDPMCGRGTTLFEALNRGWDATGTDVQAADVDEAGKFFKKYLEYHRFKHSISKKSMTVKGKEAAVMHVCEFAKDNKAFKAGDTRILRTAAADSSKISALGMKKEFHLIATDLPYGVQHGPGGARGKSLEQMVRDVLPAWREALVPGGAMALSFNTNTLKLDFVREAMSEAGLKPMTGPGYDGLAHWVEQAITRDVAVAVRA